MNRIALIPLLFAAVAFAATDSVLTEQRVVLQNLQEMDASKPGVLLTGEFKSNAGSIVLEQGESKSTEIDAATQADIEIQARPTAETRATVRFRIHQDWQKSREEGISPFLFHWLSFDGKAWEKRIDFNLGDMRVAYTPLTIFMPELGLNNEPEIFAIRRRDIMAYSNLDGSDGRLLQGLNFSMHSGKAAFLDDVYLQVTGSRLRAQAKKIDQIALDIDNTDRFLIAGRGGTDLYGLSLSAGYVYTFSRETASENFVASSVMGLGNLPYLLEDNGVFFSTLGIKIASIAGLDGWKIDLSGEYANSWYQSWWFNKTAETTKRPRADTVKVMQGGELQNIVNIVYETISSDAYSTSDNGSLNSGAVQVLLELAPPKSIADALLKFRWVQNGKNFISELAQSPSYFSSSILNASAINTLRGSSLENLYFAVYNNNPLTQLSLLGRKNVSYFNRTLAGGNNLYNNYRKAHFVRTGYTGNSLTPAERMALSPALLDPALNLSMPWGLATPDRSGFLLNLEGAILDNKVSVNANVNMVNQKTPFIDGGKAPSYLDLGAGFSVEAGRFAGLKKPLTLQAGFEKSTENDGFERTSQSSKAGLRWGIWHSISLLGGFEMVKKDYGTAVRDESEGQVINLRSMELLWLAGPEVKLSEGAYFNAQYGMLNNEYKSVSNTKLNRNIITADVRVKF
jgi:hypothetical protein